jgi:hypothetical protein
MSNLAYRETADKMSDAAVNLILNTADSIGIDLQSVLREAGLPPPTRNGRVIRIAAASSFDQQGLVFQRLVTVLCERSAQRGVQDSPTADDIHLFCSCLVNCENLEMVIERAIRFTRISNNRWGGLRCEREGARVMFSMDSHRVRNTAAPMALDLLSAAFFFKLFSWLIAEPLRLHGVNLAHDLHAGDSMARQVFTCPVQFGSADTALIFGADMLRKPVLRTYRELAEMLGRVPVALFPVPRLVSVRDQVELIFNTGAKRIDAAPQSAAREHFVSGGPGLPANAARGGFSARYRADHRGACLYIGVQLRRSIFEGFQGLDWSVAIDLPSCRGHLMVICL